jgi:DNA-binding PadR family transcriptional regulator
MRSRTDSEQGSSGQQCGSPLQGALLALLLDERDRALTGYQLTTLLRRRLGPTWKVERQSVYWALSRLVEADLACSEKRPGAAEGGRGRGAQVYWATESAERARVAWMEAPVGRDSVRDHLQIKIAVSRAVDAPRLLSALDAYERSCFELLRETQLSEVPMGSWAGISLNLARSASEQRIHGELRWIGIARGWIEDYLAEHGEASPR